MHKILPLFFLILTSCISIPEINDKFAQIDRVWLLDYQKNEDIYRYRVIDAPYLNTFSEIKKAFIALNVPVMAANFEKGEIYGQTEAPTPLTKEEWLQVTEFENPRLKEIGGWMFYFPDDPKGYIISIRATVKPIGKKTFVSLDYELSMPEYERMGIRANKTAPPSAVKIGSLKFWNKLDNLLKDVSLPKTRNRTPEEIRI